MLSFACGGAAFRAVTVATTLAIALAMVSPSAADPGPPIKLGDEAVVNTYTTDGQLHPEAKRRPDGKWVVTWTSWAQDGSSQGVFMQLYNANRTKYGGEVPVNTNTYYPQEHGRIAVAADNSFVVVWSSRHTSGVRKIQSQRFNSSGAKISDEFTVSDPSVSQSLFPDVIYLNNGDVVYCWRDPATNGVVLRRYNPDLAPLSDAVGVSSDSGASGENRPRLAALAGGGFVLVYHSIPTGSTKVISGQVFSSSGTKVGPTFQTGSGERPDVAALPNGGFIVTWHGGYLLARRFFADGTPVSDAFIVTTGYQSNYDRRVATFNDNTFVITWATLVEVTAQGADYDIMMQYFDASADRVGTMTQVNTYSVGPQQYPAVASSWVDGEFGIFYSSYQLSSFSSNFDTAVQWYEITSVTPVPPTPEPPTPAPPTPAPPTPQVACTSACLQNVCTAGSLIDITVTGVVSDDVWGTTQFTDSSNVAAAAVFAGVVADGETATVTVKCLGPTIIVPSGTANGVTTQALYGPPMFTFDLGGETKAPSPPAPPRCFSEPCAMGKCNSQGTSFDMIVEGIVSNNVWGTEVFSDDSWLGSVAVHQGVLSAGAVGTVTVSCTGARQSLTGSTQNGVTSNSFGPWQFTYFIHTGPTAEPTPTADMCVGACLHGNCPENGELFLRVFGTTFGYVWGGNVPYTADSTVSAAAVHAGLVSTGATTIVKATCVGSQSSFTGSTQNGVTTTSFGPFPASFTLSAGTNMPTVACGTADQCLKEQCKVSGRVIKVSVTGSTNSATLFWGDTLYTGDSPLSHAAVHAGLASDGQTVVLYATCQGPHDNFSGTTANGVTSTAFNAHWPASFTLSATQ